MRRSLWRMILARAVLVGGTTDSDGGRSAE